MRQSQTTNDLTESLVLDELPNQLDKSVGKLQPQAILPGNGSPDFATQGFVKWGWSVVGLAEEVDLGIQNSLPPVRKKADPTADLGKSEQLQYSGQVSPPYANRRAIQWAMPVPRPISAPIPMDPKTAAMMMPSVRPSLF